MIRRNGPPKPTPVGGECTSSSKLTVTVIPSVAVSEKQTSACPIASSSNNQHTRMELSEGNFSKSCAPFRGEFYESHF